MKRSTRAIVRDRAGDRCEYCHLHQDDLALFSFHVEHVVAKKHLGTDTVDNLAWACHHCNLAKSSNLSGVDTSTGKIALLFNPRQQHWNRHFRWNGSKLVGRTASARATIAVLNINAAQRITLRDLLITAGRHPRA